MKKNVILLFVLLCFNHSYSQFPFVNINGRDIILNNGASISIQNKNMNVSITKMLITVVISDLNSKKIIKLTPLWDRISVFKDPDDETYTVYNLPCIECNKEIYGKITHYYEVYTLNGKIKSVVVNENPFVRSYAISVNN